MPNITNLCLFCEKLTKTKYARYCSIQCCNKHKQLNKSPMELFYKNTIIPENTANCWIYKTNQKPRKHNLIYGTMYLNGKNIGAHRFSYEQFIGKIPEKYMVLHRCDNSTCVNPTHLFLGSANDNMQDKIKKGRMKVARGESHGNTNLTNNQVKEIKDKLRAGIKRRPIATQYNATLHQIGKIARGERWGHID